VNKQRLWLLMAFVCASASGIATAADAPAPVAPVAPDDSIAAQAKAMGLTVKHDAQELAKAVKEQAKKVGVAAQQGAKEVQAAATHHVKATDDKKAEPSKPPEATPVH
jgi:hypothetical protein